MSLQVCASCSTRYAAGLEACPNCGSSERADEARPLLPRLWVVCVTDGCPSEGTPRPVVLHPIAPGVLGAPTPLCADCRTVMRETDMPKITRHGGPSNAADPPLRPATVVLAEDGPEEVRPLPEATSAPAAATFTAETHAATTATSSTGEVTEYDLTYPARPEGGDDLSPGNSSSTSPASTPTPSETSDPAPPKRARGTASRSGKGRTASSTARSTATDGPKTGGE